MEADGTVGERKIHCESTRTVLETSLCSQSINNFNLHGITKLLLYLLFYDANHFSSLPYHISLYLCVCE